MSEIPDMFWIAGILKVLNLLDSLFNCFSNTPLN